MFAMVGGGKSMELKQHYNIDTYLKETLRYLEQDESLNNLMLGICNRIKDDPNYYTNVYMTTVSKKGGLVLAAIKTDMEKLIIYGTRDECDEAIELIVKDILSKSIYIPGVAGPKELSKRVCEIWSKHVNSNVRLDMNMRVYELKEVKRDLIEKGTLRLANERDIEFIAKGIYEFEIDAGLNSKSNKGKCLEEAQNRILDKAIYLWGYEGKVVSMAAKTRPTQNGVTIALVYTPKRLRKKGYATSCVASLSQHLLDCGYKFCTLSADLANPISNSIYTKIGYKSIGDFNSYIIENMDDVKLISPSKEYENKAFEYIQEFSDYNSEINGTGGLDRFENYDDWLLKLEKDLDFKNIPEGRVPANTYFLIRILDNKIVGMINIRHKLSESLLNMGGHIGYSIRPTERNKGYGTIMLKLGLEKCREINLDKVLITCDKANLASAKVIQRNNGLLENEIFSDIFSEVVQRYWINL